MLFRFTIPFETEFVQENAKRFLSPLKSGALGKRPNFHLISLWVIARNSAETIPFYKILTPGN